MKKSLRKILGMGVAALCMGAVLTACSGASSGTEGAKKEEDTAVTQESAGAEQASDKKQFVIGMSQCNLGEPWRVAMNDQIKMEAEKHPEFKVIYADAAQDNSKQIADIQNFIQQKVDLISLTSCAFTGLHDISIFPLGFCINHGQYQFFIGRCVLLVQHFSDQSLILHDLLDIMMNLINLVAGKEHEKD